MASQVGLATPRAGGLDNPRAVGLVTVAGELATPRAVGLVIVAVGLVPRWAVGFWK